MAAGHRSGRRRHRPGFQWRVLLRQRHRFHRRFVHQRRGYRQRPRTGSGQSRIRHGCDPHHRSIRFQQGRQCRCQRCRHRRRRHQQLEPCAQSDHRSRQRPNPDRGRPDPRHHRTDHQQHRHPHPHRFLRDHHLEHRHRFRFPHRLRHHHRAGLHHHRKHRRYDFPQREPQRPPGRHHLLLQHPQPRCRRKSRGLPDLLLHHPPAA